VSKTITLPPTKNLKMFFQKAVELLTDKTEPPMTVLIAHCGVFLLAKGEADFVLEIAEGLEKHDYRRMFLQPLEVAARRWKGETVHVNAMVSVVADDVVKRALKLEVGNKLAADGSNAVASGD